MSLSSNCLCLAIVMLDHDKGKKTQGCSAIIQQNVRLYSAKGYDRNLS